MNSLRVLVFSLLFLGCKSQERHIKINQSNSTLPIILKYNKTFDKFSKIKIPLKLRVHNTSNKEDFYSLIRYEYNSNIKGISETLYETKNNNLLKVRNNKKKSLKGNQHIQYILYTNHKLDSSIQTQVKFRKYLDIVRKNETDTLIIGTIADFKVYHKNILKALTDHDSIRLDMWDAKDIRIPVQF